MFHLKSSKLGQHNRLKLMLTFIVETILAAIEDGVMIKVWIHCFIVIIGILIIVIALCSHQTVFTARAEQ